ncbi:helix-turn-helix transcriptional regulator [Bacillus pumilus]|uniref:helix-turn-helix domain-containing protein n=1 Tax=Bacillus TaxID=1386 RepID=UPI000C23DA08|nr:MULTISPECIES: helix-turn-helix transcriptional regulator [Bacillus]PJI12441.1 transcriptional regulator [Bacillus altitudinis]PKQ85544.1 XRE family transcriptional regulator [Bacillus altitudinis]QLI77183.1 helix-turn-helix transcriptional regulator [Bacillus pumilus]WIG31159.1 helix-turn-helix transcriptional regulator [Bacillus pumilus]
MRLRINELLQKHGYTQQKDFAAKTGLSTRTVSEMCSGKMKRYPKDVLEKVIKEFDLTDANDLFDISD